MTATLERMLAIAGKAARQTFNKQGEVRPMWVGHPADGGELVVVIPEKFGNTDDKDAAVAAARKIFKARGVVAFAFMTEAWTVDSGSMPPAAFLAAISLKRDESLERHPDRHECVVVQAEDKSGRSLVGMCRILRPEHGKPTLAPTFKIDEAFRFTGRMTGLLRDDEQTTRREPE